MSLCTRVGTTDLEEGGFGWGNVAEGGQAAVGGGHAATAALHAAGWGLPCTACVPSCSIQRLLHCTSLPAQQVPLSQSIGTTLE